MNSIDNSLISLSELANINGQEHILQSFSVQLLKKGNIWFMQDHQGDENDDPIVPPN
ncbi:hypothetical protein IQ226_14430 [Dolichospermum sp. LEGE 00240]|jgi:hypothetical protein|uniref:hypothetical protein n=1 Tax=Aphanizomenonaceae TaxID=1892259 RepID=UPI0018821741|nr:MULTISPECIES: hypothetical protein [Aphanizomenonaceae]MDM3844196.1 hypothetical protein [Aphanizomenon gracile PMC638.10]MDM3850312.1 hypothetical protein [Aphanizomenon gracile PMC627.10]MDM3854493.1 hypothetical protein [Aphanizomenon gracile PMC649.10]MDM3860447.1 hypothetical protein [Aphanizomenon gracile PMC644.10]MBE9250324.1 hypothetical protein [Dolichospermum sp. LEGE 00240]